ncbi:MAG: DNA double-strand break repair nuclease NurA [Elainella sp.]
MLDLIKLSRQMQGIGQHLTQEAAASRQRLELAQRILADATEQQAELMNQQQLWRDRLGFTAAVPMEPLNTRVALTHAPPVHSVLATDGSQIAPSHHEIAYCYLINVGRVVLHYGQNRHPLLDSAPEVFYRPEDLYVSRQWGIRTEEWMGYRRTVSEAVVLAELGTDLADLQAPALAMVDGSLIHWFLDPLPAEARERILPPILAAWQQLQANRIPLVGYLSAARSGEAMNFLRLQSCTYLAPDCQTHCSGQTDQAPCQVFSPLRDTALWGLLLEPGERGAIWRSSAKILEAYGEQHIYFCYVHMGAEVARVEFPGWVATDEALLNQALSLTLTQVQKGYGYPVALAEAHNQAVVRGGDRARFFGLLEQQMIRAGLKNIGTSYKEARKRGSIA